MNRLKKSNKPVIIILSFLVRYRYGQKVQIEVNNVFNPKSKIENPKSRIHPY